MKKNRKVEKIDKEKKSVLKRIIKSIFLIILIFVLLITIGTIYSMFNNKLKNNTIIATKTIIEDGQEQKIKYKIRIKDYVIESAIKEITFKTAEEAKSELGRYEMINIYERREIGLEAKNKKLILTMPIEQLLQDIEYTKDKIFIKTEDGEEKETIEQDELKKCLINQGYEIK